MTLVKKCPKCGSASMQFVHKGDRGYYECNACGYAGSHVHEEEEETNPEISW